MTLRIVSAVLVTMAVIAPLRTPISPQEQPATPLDPIDAIIEACRSHQIVALGEAHDNEQEQAVRLALIRDPRFARCVNAIVVEFGNALYQDTIDRFVRGEEVPQQTLRRVWQDTTQHAVWDSPIYEEFLRAVRTVNHSVPAERQIRVLLGDPAIDWEAVHSPQDHWKWMLQRDTFPAQLIETDVVKKHRHALVIYGDSHLQRHPIETNYSESSNPRFNTLISLLEQSPSHPTLFSILVPTSVDVATLQPSIKSWSPPRLALTRGTLLGSADFVSFFKNPPDRRTIRDGALASVERDQWRRMPMEQEFDAILYLGPPASLTSRGLPSDLCNDAAYMQMRESRFAIVNAKQGFETLKERCASIR
jgi:Haem-binding uptake, Tiki superfamily, ChaN